MPDCYAFQNGKKEATAKLWEKNSRRRGNQNGGGAKAAELASNASISSAPDAGSDWNSDTVPLHT